MLSQGYIYSGNGLPPVCWTTTYNGGHVYDGCSASVESALLDWGTLSYYAGALSSSLMYPGSYTFQGKHNDWFSIGLMSSTGSLGTGLFAFVHVRRLSGSQIVNISTGYDTIVDLAGIWDTSYATWSPIAVPADCPTVWEALLYVCYQYSLGEPLNWLPEVVVGYASGGVHNFTYIGCSRWLYATCRSFLDPIFLGPEDAVNMYDQTTGGALTHTFPGHPAFSFSKIYAAISTDLP